MGGRLFKALLQSRRFISALLMITFLVGSFGEGLIRGTTKVAEATQVAIDSDAFITGTSHIQSGSQTVFTSDQTGYKFYRDAVGYCVYRKTTDGGASWSATTTVDSQTDCNQVTVWYDGWTPGLASTSIHIATFDSNSDDIWYNRLDTDTDTLLLGGNPVSMMTGSGQGGTTLTVGENYTSITRGTDGTLYALSNDGSGASFDSFVVECTVSCGVAGNWTETGSNPFDVASDQNILVPLSGGDVMIIQRDISLDDIRSRIWDDSLGVWDVGGWTTIDSHAPDNTTYDVGMSISVSLLNPGDVYLAYTASSTGLGNDDEIRTARYSGGSWTNTKEVVRYTEMGITNVALALDASNDDVYVAYSAQRTPGTLASGNVYWRKSTDNMTSWTYEQGPVNTSGDDIYGVDLNTVNSERIYVSWFDDVDNDIFGDTLADIFPGVHVTTEEFEITNANDSYTQVTIDPTAHANGTSHIMSGSQTVFVSDQTGYKFFRDAPGFCVYSKTTNGGSSWGATTSVDSQLDCHQVTVWYDGWTPGLASSSIHIVTADAGSDDLWYNRLDTSSDTLLSGSTPVSMTTGQGGSLTEGENYVSVTRGTDGTLYAVSDDGTTGPDSYVVECIVSCNVAGNWSETGTSPLDGTASDQNILMPLSGGDIMLINRDISGDLIRYKTWDNANWSGSWTNIGTSATENATYDVGMAAVLSTTTGNIYLAYIANNATPGTDDQIRTALYSGGSWSAETSVATSTVLGLTNVAIALDYSTDDVYVAYSARTTAATAGTANLLWKKSTDDMSTWSYEQGPINTYPSDIYGVDLNLLSDARVYTTWFDNVLKDVYGATLQDLPSATVETTPSQIDSTYASTSEVYIGGVFTLYNTNDAATRDVTGITITESGSIDGLNDIASIDLLYELDTSAPLDCASEAYDGSESPFGSTDSNGFSGSDGVSSFTGTTVSLDETNALCVYPVLHIKDTAQSSSTIEIEIANPSTDIIVTSDTAGPPSVQSLPGTTLVYNDITTLSHYHWRENDGTQATATSKTTGVEDTPLTTMRQGSTTRLRIEVSNEGSSSTPAMQYRLEYAPNPSSCDVATGWTDVGAVDGDFDMADSIHLTEGGDTTDIAPALGGVTNDNDVFVTPNGGVRDTTSQTGSLILSPTDFVELEYSIVASTSASEGSTYCFRVTNSGNALFTYTNYPRANIAADVLVTIATTSQSATTSIPSADFYVGSTFVITENSGSRNVSEITITENGSVDASTGLDNIRLYYDMDVTAPYNCTSESYIGGATQFGSTDTDGFSAANGSSTFTTGGSVTISTTSTMCLYTVVDVTSQALNGETIDIIMESPSTNLLVTGGGSVSPSITRDMNGSTTLVGAVLTQTHYHWRSDTGNEGGASSLSGGSEDFAITNVAESTPVRLRLQVSNEGSVTSGDTVLRLEYGAKISTCSAVSSWIDVGATDGAFDMYDSTHITEGDDTTDIAGNIGGVTNENTLFISPNSAIKDTSSEVATTTFTSSQYVEAEYSIRQTVDAGKNITYCFRLSNAGSALGAYTTYPELTTSPDRDFEIQRDTETFATQSLTLTAGVDYIAPSASTSAFVRITNSHYTGAGDASAGGTQAPDDATAFILDPSNIMTSFTIQRPPTALATTTRVSWEIVEFIGEPGSDNEMIVRAQGSHFIATTSVSATGTAVSTVVDDADVVVFITGQSNYDTAAADENTGIATSNWLASSNQPTFWRGEANGSPMGVSYAVVEFTGPNWEIQRVEHTFTAAGASEFENISPVNSIDRTFLHTQKRSGVNLAGDDEYGAEVWMSGIGQVYFFLQSAATSPTLQTSVAWVIENTQTTSGAMEVTRDNDNLNGGPEPSLYSMAIGKTLSDITNTSLFINNRAAGTGSAFPRPIIGATIASTTHYELWRSDTGAAVDYRLEIVEWPTAGLAINQNHYQFFVDNNALDPTDAWPEGASNLGEDTVLTGENEPLGEDERIRIRISLQALNATLPAGTRAFKLQYGQMDTTCGAIAESSWNTVGDTSSSTIWRGYNATGTVDGTQLSGDPPSVGDLNLLNSDVAGTYEETNDTDVNLYAVQVNEDIEYDWLVEQNGAIAETFYCFRMVDANGTPLDSYDEHPRLRTASFSPKTQNWRWYNGVSLDTPTTTLAAENVAPIDIENGQEMTLRVTVKEVKHIARDDVRFKLQYSEHADFLVTNDVVATSSCIATSTWCYVNGGGVDNAVIASSTLSDTDLCILSVGNGCGTHNESANVLTGYRHQSNAASEYSFTLKSAGPRVNRVYYFRLYDVVQDIPVTTNSGEAYPSLVTEGSSLVFTMEGIASSTVIEGVTTDLATTPVSIPFGTLTASTTLEAAQRLTIDTNGTEGHRILMMLTSDLMSSSGAVMHNVTGTNNAPSSWSGGCLLEARSCFGYHAGDDTLQGGSARFAANDTYAGFSTTTPEEISFVSQPVVGETTDIIFKIMIRNLQSAGQYEARVMYLSIPIF